MSYGFKIRTFPKLILSQEVETTLEGRSCSLKLANVTSLECILILTFFKKPFYVFRKTAYNRRRRKHFGARNT